MDTFTNPSEILEDALFILAVDKEERAYFALNKFIESDCIADSVLVFAYNDDFDSSSLKAIVDSSKLKIITGYPTSQKEFISQMKNYKSMLLSNRIVVDISCILTPYVFLLFKCIQTWNNRADIIAINTIPNDYNYNELPFTSYKSYYGDLKMEEILGYGSAVGSQCNKDLFVFAGFEKALALKIKEETDYQHFYFVNALPSYHQKYKDISIINNYQLIISESCKRLFAPAINPYEVFNILEKNISPEHYVNIAPLCTKPIALGICLYALKHENIRIVYPFSDKYEHERSHKVYKAFTYKIIL